jgi:hypothetical protein
MTSSSGAVNQTIVLSQFYNDRANEDGSASLIRKPVFLTPAQAAELVQSGDTILISGSGGGVGTPERFLEALPPKWTTRRNHRGPSGWLRGLG